MDERTDMATAAYKIVIPTAADREHAVTDACARHDVDVGASGGDWREDGQMMYLTDHTLKPINFSRCDLSRFSDTMYDRKTRLFQYFRRVLMVLQKRK
ncbi:Hypothetical predicted protein [Octopus vulgaris]|uniref:Uncharacterized protein n=1 Tax=Octopus vulgaris TaxID=6645 RepID=A0AA36BQF2_OCTVU|nr:Hypothetical predicted protein [Octopus vulgaris]